MGKIKPLIFILVFFLIVLLQNSVLFHSHENKSETRILPRGSKIRAKNNRSNKQISLEQSSSINPQDFNNDFNGKFETPDIICPQVLDPCNPHPPPTITILSPSVNQTINGLINVSAHITAYQSGVAQAFVTLDETEIHPIYFPYNWAWNTSNYIDGIHTIKINATDSDGLPSSASENVTIDNTGPAINFILPQDQSSVNGIVNITITSTDSSGIANASMAVDSGNWILNTTNQFTWYWNSETVGDGSHNISVKVTDLLGNQRVKSVTINVENNPTTSSNQVSSTGTITSSTGSQPPSNSQHPSTSAEVSSAPSDTVSSPSHSSSKSKSSPFPISLFVFNLLLIPILLKVRRKS